MILGQTGYDSDDQVASVVTGLVSLIYGNRRLTRPQWAIVNGVIERAHQRVAAGMYPAITGADYNVLARLARVHVDEPAKM